MADADDVSQAREVTVSNADYWASRALNLAALLGSGVKLVADPSGAAPHPESMAVIVEPAWWAARPRELADALSAAGRVPAGTGATPATQSGAVTSGGERLTLTVEEAASALGIGRASAYEAVHRGEIPCIRIGRRILVPRVALDRLLSAVSPDGIDGA